MQLQYETSQLPYLRNINKQGNTPFRTNFEAVISTVNEKKTKRSQTRCHVGNENKLRNRLGFVSEMKYVNRFISVLFYSILV